MATPNSVTAKKLPIPVDTKTKVISLTLKLTKTEAEDILRLCEYIGGQPTETRGIFDNVRAVLRDKGFVATTCGKCFAEERDGPANVQGFHFIDYSDRPKLIDTSEKW